ncbi:MAG TPA: 23S rRNA (pseudouridine(1915)-N(3))-methyltransferase RlmH [Candidatus Saccharimonadales bacterium]|nr:23S rRNA (pseudouridine(1915)-N(3))-methyltransferase RlmH [Candidatus Saccharimonadales bacterium]
MKLHIITVGKPKLGYAQAGWEEYWARLKHYHQLRTTHVPDKHNDATHVLEAASTAYIVALSIPGRQLSSEGLASFLQKRELTGKETAFVIGGPEGLPQAVLDKADYQLSLGSLTLPHDLAMVVLLESLYRASTINSGHPYHK